MAAILDCESQDKEPIIEREKRSSKKRYMSACCYSIIIYTALLLILPVIFVLVCNLFTSFESLQSTSYVVLDTGCFLCRPVIVKEKLIPLNESNVDTMQTNLSRSLDEIADEGIPEVIAKTESTIFESEIEDPSILKENEKRQLKEEHDNVEHSQEFLEKPLSQFTSIGTQTKSKDSATSEEKPKQQLKIQDKEDTMNILEEPTEKAMTQSTVEKNSEVKSEDSSSFKQREEQLFNDEQYKMKEEPREHTSFLMSIYNPIHDFVMKVFNQIKSIFFS